MPTALCVLRIVGYAAVLVVLRARLRTVRRHRLPGTVGRYLDRHARFVDVPGCVATATALPATVHVPRSAGSSGLVAA